MKYMYTYIGRIEIGSEMCIQRYEIKQNFKYWAYWAHPEICVCFVCGCFKNLNVDMDNGAFALPCPRRCSVGYNSLNGI